MSVYDEIKAEGRNEGKAEGKLELLLKLLAQRGLVLDDDLRARVTACTNEALRAARLGLAARHRRRSRLRPGSRCGSENSAPSR